MNMQEYIEEAEKDLLHTYNRYGRGEHFGLFYAYNEHFGRQAVII